MVHATGFWQSVVLPKLDELAPRSRWEAILSACANKDKDRAAGGEDRKLQHIPTLDAYPYGITLRVEGRKASRNFKPKSTEPGDFLRWGCSSPGGVKAQLGYPVGVNMKS